jgi:hypothetical protein
MPAESLFNQHHTIAAFVIDPLARLVRTIYASSPKGRTPHALIDSTFPVTAVHPWKYPPEWFQEAWARFASGGPGRLSGFRISYCRLLFLDLAFRRSRVITLPSLLTSFCSVSTPSIRAVDESHAGPDHGLVRDGRAALPTPLSSLKLDILTHLLGHRLLVQSGLKSRSSDGEPTFHRVEP